MLAIVLAIAFPVSLRGYAFCCEAQSARAYQTQQDDPACPGPFCGIEMKRPQGPYTVNILLAAPCSFCDARLV
jgi:hypothetical protein